VGGQLCFSGGHGGSAVIGGCWHLWVVTKVSGGGKKRVAVFGEHDAKQTLFVWSLHMRSSHVLSMVR